MSSPAAKHAHHLSVEIGPRRSTEDTESRASHYCASVFEAAGLVTRVEPFLGLHSFGQVYIPLTAGILASALMAAGRKPRRLRSLAIGVSSMVAFAGEMTKRNRVLSDRLAKSPSQNVVAVLPSAEAMQRRLVLVAHVDSSRSGLAFHPKLAKDFRRNTMIGLGAGVSAVAAALLPRRLRRTIGAAASAIIANALLVLVHRELAGTDVAGANDNASGAGVLLALAEALTLDPLKRTEVWFVATGCEESDLVGMSAFMDKHGHELQDASFLNFDTVAGPGTTIRWITESSILEPLAADPRLIDVAEEVSDEHPEFEAQPGTWRAAGLDTDVAAVRGFRQMSLVATTPEGTLPNWHWPTDVYENIDENVLERAYGFALEIIRRIDAR
jgi:hypothetical protein